MMRVMLLWLLIINIAHANEYNLKLGVGAKYQESINIYLDKKVGLELLNYSLLEEYAKGTILGTSLEVNHSNFGDDTFSDTSLDYNLFLLLGYDFDTVYDIPLVTKVGYGHILYGKVNNEFDFQEIEGSILKAAIEVEYLENVSVGIEYNRTDYQLKNSIITERMNIDNLGFYLLFKFGGK